MWYRFSSGSCSISSPLQRLHQRPQSFAAIGRSQTSWSSTAFQQDPSDAVNAIDARQFEKLVHKAGLSVKKLHRLYPHCNGTEADAGVYPIAVALSGGADSMALMLLLRQHLRQRHIRTPLLAITIDHRLRSESRQEAQEVGAICTKKWQVKHIIAQWDRKRNQDNTEQRPRLSKMQEAARKSRYALLHDVCQSHGVEHLFVAHHLGDQLETVLLRLGRASGITGLAGIHRSIVLPSTSSTQVPVTLVRPLLSIPKDVLKATCRHFRQLWIEDPSNDSMAFDRVRIRKALAQVEQETPDVVNILRDFQQIAERAHRELFRAERRIFRKYVSKSDQKKNETPIVLLRTAAFDDPRMFDELRHRVLSSIILAVGKRTHPPRLTSIMRLQKDLAALAPGKRLTIGGCRITLNAKRQCYQFRKE